MAQDPSLSSCDARLATIPRPCNLCRGQISSHRENFYGAPTPTTASEAPSGARRSAITAQYARFFFGAEREEAWTAALLGLERNWAGGRAPGAKASDIPHTLMLLRAAAGGNYSADWRATMYLKRAYYDAYVQARCEAAAGASHRPAEALQ